MSDALIFFMVCAGVMGGIWTGSPIGTGRFIASIGTAICLAIALGLAIAAKHAP